MGRERGMRVSEVFASDEAHYHLCCRELFFVLFFLVFFSCTKYVARKSQISINLHDIYRRRQRGLSDRGRRVPKAAAASCQAAEFGRMSAMRKR